MNQSLNDADRERRLKIFKENEKKYIRTKLSISVLAI